MTEEGENKEEGPITEEGLLKVAGLAGIYSDVVDTAFFTSELAGEKEAGIVATDTALICDSAFLAVLGLKTTGAVAALWLTQPGANGLAVLLWTELATDESACSVKAPAIDGISVWLGEDNTTLVLLTTKGSPFNILVL